MTQRYIGGDGTAMGTGYQIDLGSMTQLVNTLKTAAQSITDANTALQTPLPINWVTTV
ncbi:MAG TPA: hypothetical protein VJ914_36765 [Pseudonocardiaceae bacterium]|nr:hypothetical protein [Pseudonocardiaceae bacterium]